MQNFYLYKIRTSKREDLSGHYSLLLTQAEKVENLNSWHNFLFVVFTPQTANRGLERWLSSPMKTMHYQRMITLN